MTAVLDVVAEILAPQFRRAACKNLARVMDPPPRELTQEAVEEARAVCLGCPDLDACRAWVLGLDERDDPSGVCGGLTEAERFELRGVTRRPPAGAPDGHKLCRRCGETKPRAGFYRDARNFDGLNSYCKACNGAATKAAALRRKGKK